MALYHTFHGPQHLSVNGMSNFDTGVGVHLSHGNGGYSEESIRLAIALGVRTFKLLSLGHELGDARSETIQRILRFGGFPVSRIYPDTGWQSIDAPRAGAHTLSLKRNFAEAGYPDLAPIVQVFNEPNLNREWNADADSNRQMPDGAPELIARQWYPCALAVLAAGGRPTTPSLAPGGNYNDWRWAVRMYREIARLAAGYPGGARAFFEQIIIAVHNYTDNKRLKWGKGGWRKWTLHDFTRPDWTGVEFAPGHEDSQGWYAFEWYHDLVQHLTGADCQVISLEGGTYPGNNGMQHAPFRPIDAALHASYTTSQMELMMGGVVNDAEVVGDTVLQGVPEYYRATAFWAWGEQPGWAEGDFLRLPATLQRMREMHIRPRQIPPAVVISPTAPLPVEQPVIVATLAVEYRHPGRNGIDGDAPVGAEISVIDAYGNPYRTVAGTKPEHGTGGWHIDLYGEPDSVTVSVSGAMPLKVPMNGHIPFITMHASIPVAPIEPAPILIEPQPIPQPQPKGGDMDPMYKSMMLHQYSYCRERTIEDWIATLRSGGIDCFKPKALDGTTYMRAFDNHPLALGDIYDVAHQYVEFGKVGIAYIPWVNPTGENWREEARMAITVGQQCNNKIEVDLEPYEHFWDVSKVGSEHIKDYFQMLKEAGLWITCNVDVRSNLADPLRLRRIAQYVDRFTSQSYDIWFSALAERVIPYREVFDHATRYLQRIGAKERGIVLDAGAGAGITERAAYAQQLGCVEVSCWVAHKANRAVYEGFAAIPTRSWLDHTTHYEQLGGFVGRSGEGNIPTAGAYAATAEIQYQEHSEADMVYLVESKKVFREQK